MGYDDLDRDYVRRLQGNGHIRFIWQSLESRHGVREKIGTHVLATNSIRLYVAT